MTPFPLNAPAPQSVIYLWKELFHVSYGCALVSNQVASPTASLHTDTRGCSQKVPEMKAKLIPVSSGQVGNTVTPRHEHKQPQDPPEASEGGDLRMVPGFESLSKQSPSSPGSENPSCSEGGISPDLHPTTEPALLPEGHTFPCRWGRRYLRGPLGNSCMAVPPGLGHAPRQRRTVWLDRAAALPWLAAE